MIDTGGGLLPVKGKGTIAMYLLRSDGKVQSVTFSDVLGIPDMFTTFISHCQLSEKLRGSIVYTTAGKDSTLRFRYKDTELAVLNFSDSFSTSINNDAQESFPPAHHEQAATQCSSAPGFIAQMVGAPYLTRRKETLQVRGP